MLKTLIKIRLQGILLRQTRSSKKSKGNGLGKIILLMFVFAYVAVVFVGMFGLLFSTLIEPLHLMGIDWLYFAIMSLVIIMLCFIGSVFLTHHEIYEAKDNQLLLAMPIKNSDILLSRVFTILILNYIYEILVAAPAFYVYITTLGMNVVQIIMFLIVFLTLPLFVLAITCLFSWILAHVMVRVKMKNVISIVLFMGFMFLYFYAINSVEQYIGLLIANGQSIASAIEKTVFPLYHLSLALQDGNFVSMLIYLVCALLPFGIVIYILSTNFVKMATTKPKVKKVKYAAKPMKANSVKKALLVREVKHFTSNAMVMLNGAMGIIICIIASVGILFYADNLKLMLAQIPELKSMVTPLLCIAVIGTSSLNMISASSISLEGDRLWIIKSLPIDAKEVLDVKLALHLFLCAPAGILFSLVLIVIFQVGFVDALLVLITPILFTILIDLMGLLLNLWKPKFDWINETVCVKQSMPVMITMFVSMGLAGAMAMVYGLWLIDFMSINIYMYLLIGITIAVDAGLYYMVKTWGVRQYNAL